MRPAPTLAELPAPPSGRRGWPWTEGGAALPERRPDGSRWPRVSVVTPSFNQAAFLEETLRSVLLQGYPELEYVVIDAGSRDGSAEIVRRYAPWLAHWDVIADRGHGATLNVGFARTTGEVLGFLNSDDILLPGALARAATEIDPARGRHVVQGRCPFIDPQSRAIGLEHPSRFRGHWRVLAVWKGHTIPQPAVFWSRQAWRATGPLTEAREERWIDYDLFCRMSRHFRFHTVDQALAAYRLHPDSLTVRWEAGAKRREILAISRRHWGGVALPSRLALAVSRALAGVDRVGRAHRSLERARQDARRGATPRAVAHAAVAALLAPATVVELAIRRVAPFLAARALARLDRRRSAPFGGWTDAWPDGWAGPLLRLERQATGGETRLRLEGVHVARYLGAPLRLSVAVDGERVAELEIAAGGPFREDLELPAPLAAGAVPIEIQASPWFVPHSRFANRDCRPLAWQAHRIELAREPAAPGTRC